jgi:hypothetical protein
LDHVPNCLRSSIGTPIISAITQTGNTSAKAVMNSISSPSTNCDSKSSVTLPIAPAIDTTALGVNAYWTRRRNRVWMGGS